MPMLDVSFVVSDPMLADTFDVTRNAETIDTNGRLVITTTLTKGVIGTVTQQDPADLLKRDDGQLVPRCIFIASTFAFRNAVTGFQPDTITWNGSNYKVKQVYPYSRFGQGIYECVAETFVATDPVQ